MKDYSEFVDVTLSDFTDNKDCAKELSEFKSARKNEMRNRELTLRKRGLSDSRVIYDLIISENLDTRHDFIKGMRRSMEERIEKQRMLIKLLISVAYFMAIGIYFILDSFYNKDWEHSWLIVIGGIFIYVMTLFLMPKKLHYKGRRYFPLTVALMICTMITALYVFLIMISFGIPQSYIVIPAALTLIAFIDATVPAIRKHKFYIIHTLIATPLFGLFLYLTLAIEQVVPWATGWLLIIAALIVDIFVLIGAMTKRIKMMKGGEE